VTPARFLRTNTTDSWLDRPCSTSVSVAAWVAATALFIGVTQWWGGPTAADANVVVYLQWALAHGHFACGYPPVGVVGYAPAAPVYPLLGGAVAFVLRVGHSVAFPSAVVLGTRCHNASLSITSWALRSRAWTTTLRIGYASWLVLLAGCISLLRSFDLGRSRREVLMVVALALTPSVGMCLWQYFHPQDVVALGLVLAALGSCRRGRWTLAGALFALALMSQQFALLVFAPWCLVAPRGDRVRFFAGAVACGGLVALPLALATSGRSLTSTFLGTGYDSWTASLLVQTGLRGSGLFTVARVAPLVVSLCLAWWLSNRLGDKLFEPVPLLAFLALAMCGRLVLEINLWGYYFMAVSVALVLLDVVRARLRTSLLAWLAVVTYAVFHGLSNGSTSHVPVYAWQVVLVGGAIVLSLSPLVTYLREESQLATEWPTSVS